MARNTIELPEDLYNALRRQAAIQHKSPDTLVAEWVSARLDVGSESEGNKRLALEQEIAAFEKLKPTLLKEYAGQYVAMFRGKVVASGLDKLELSRRVREKIGEGGYYIEFVSSGTPRSVRIISPRVVRE